VRGAGRDDHEPFAVLQLVGDRGEQELAELGSVLLPPAAVRAARDVQTADGVRELPLVGTRDVDGERAVARQRPREQVAVPKRQLEQQSAGGQSRGDLLHGERLGSRAERLQPAGILGRERVLQSAQPRGSSLSAPLEPRELGGGGLVVARRGEEVARQRELGPGDPPCPRLLAFGGRAAGQGRTRRHQVEDGARAAALGVAERALRLTGCHRGTGRVEVRLRGRVVAGLRRSQRVGAEAFAAPLELGERGVVAQQGPLRIAQGFRHSAGGVERRPRNLRLAPPLRPELCLQRVEALACGVPSLEADQALQLELELTPACRAPVPIELVDRAGRWLAEVGEGGRECPGQISDLAVDHRRPAVRPVTRGGRRGERQLLLLSDHTRARIFAGALLLCAEDRRKDADHVELLVDHPHQHLSVGIGARGEVATELGELRADAVERAGVARGHLCVDDLDEHRDALPLVFRLGERAAQQPVRRGPVGQRAVNLRLVNEHSSALLRLAERLEERAGQPIGGERPLAVCLAQQPVPARAVEQLPDAERPAAVAAARAPVADLPSGPPALGQAAGRDVGQCPVRGGQPLAALVARRDELALGLHGERAGRVGVVLEPGEVAAPQRDRRHAARRARRGEVPRRPVVRLPCAVHVEPVPTRLARLDGPGDVVADTDRPQCEVPRLRAAERRGSPVSVRQVAERDPDRIALVLGAPPLTLEALAGGVELAGAPLKVGRRASGPPLPAGVGGGLGAAQRREPGGQRTVGRLTDPREVLDGTTSRGERRRRAQRRRLARRRFGVPSAGGAARHQLGAVHGDELGQLAGVAARRRGERLVERELASPSTSSAHGRVPRAATRRRRAPRGVSRPGTRSCRPR
jgi:hypothetical protein